MELNEILEQLRGFATTELCDGMTEFRVLDPAIHRMVTHRKIVGPAFPVEIPAGVSGILPDALMQIQPGQVMVVAAQGYTAQTCWGDYRSFCAAMQQVEGVVIDGAFRDIDLAEGLALFDDLAHGEVVERPVEQIHRVDKVLRFAATEDDDEYPDAVFLGGARKTVARLRGVTRL